MDSFKLKQGVLVYYKDLDNNLHIIRADTTDALEARASVADLLDEMTVSKDNWKKPVLALIEGGKT